MISALLWGAGIGVGLWALVVYVFPPRPPLRALVDRLHATPAPPPILTADSDGWALRVGRPFIKPLAALGLPHRTLRNDLAVTGKSIEHHLAEKATLALTGLLLPILMHLLLVVADVGLGWEIPAVASLLFALGGFLLPDISVRQEAERRRSTFRHALSAYLNLIRVLLAGGAGVDGALSDAVNIGKGWAFQQLRRALVTAKLTRTTPWSTLGQLGTELDVHQLSELAASVSLAGTEGARVRASLAAKAAALRTRELTDAEGEAQAATERMSLPVVMLFGGFLIFIGFPALASVLGGL
ncbi:MULTISPECIES: type II secretion system F family protein [Pseudonocardiaceae]|uniref:Secretion system protein n=2 Tax=Pseudonocardiaceae TaxID=2070 RepID=A0A2V4AF25_9PSEU|nr:MULTISPECIES: type II secretion system F family protein [Pseudonocardiaceae]MBE1579505.1 Flp pilus assembly protein TadB [Amycolatopsis roodepoortensis]OLZ45584.1 secretion system protein [Amycolatopsis keratiniphila subsp. nogabecina]PXY17839.1 secretion system protein [Prauserella muralis]TWE14959.1 type II secretion system (T2SS) protein F [Prauserella muralis]SDU62990.1 Type II secretion system (T2SS), protein F [Amycolatopsis keratiniphila]